MNFFRSPTPAAGQSAGFLRRVLSPTTGPDSQRDSAGGVSTSGSASDVLAVDRSRTQSGLAGASMQPTGAAAGDIGGHPSEAGFLVMQMAFRASGGLARGDDLVRWLQGHSSSDVASLARLIVMAELFSFEWRDTYWVPMFQFDLDDLSIKRGPRQVMIELASEFDSWSLAAWFAQPNTWLSNTRPVDQLDHNLAGVLRAARADRLVAAG
jgi:hypothetical protein